CNKNRTFGGLARKLRILRCPERDANGAGRAHVEPPTPGDPQPARRGTTSRSKDREPRSLNFFLRNPFEIICVLTLFSSLSGTLAWGITMDIQGFPFPNALDRISTPGSPPSHVGSAKSEAKPHFRKCWEPLSAHRGASGSGAVFHIGAHRPNGILVFCCHFDVFIQSSPDLLGTSCEMGAGALTICKLTRPPVANMTDCSFFFRYFKQSKAAVRLKEDMKKIAAVPLNEQRNSTYTKLFGVSLQDLHQQGLTENGVPAIVGSIVEYLTMHGLAQEGLFRVNGNVRVVEQLRWKFESGVPVELGRDGDVCAAASLLKLFLRELPEGVITSALQPRFIQLFQVSY
ncbi:hypothetical protein E2I00_001470, partial [Balaenoptera physalus]